MFFTKSNSHWTRIIVPIILPTVLAVILFTGSVFLVLLPTHESSLLKSHKMMVRELTMVVWKLIQGYEQRVQAEEILLKEAQKRVKQRISTMRYGSEHNNYFWLLGKQSHLVMHPTHPELVGKSLPALKDHQGKELLPEMVKVAGQNGGGYTHYLWHKPNSPEDPELKIAYTRNFEAWGWTIGTGIRVVELQEETAALTQKLEYLFYWILTLLAIFSLYLIWRSGLFEKSRLKAFDKLQASQQRIRESELKYRRILENMQEGYIEFNQSGGVTFFNQAMMEILEYSEKSLRQLVFRQQLALSDVSEAYRVFNRVWTTGVPCTDFQCHVKKKGGERACLEISISLHTSIKQEKDGFQCIVRDISQRKQDELELQRLRNEFKDVFDSSPSMLVCVDDENRITRCNQKTEQITEMSQVHLAGKLFSAVFPDLPAANTELDRVIEKRHPSINKRVASKIAEENRYFDIVIYPFLSKGSQGCVIRIDDVSERVHMEAMMMQTEKVMSLGGLAAGMAHEINNPLGGISMSNANIKRRIDPELTKNQKTAEACGISLKALHQYFKKRKIHHSFEIIDDCVRRAAGIITDMLHFSRQSDSTLAPADLADLVDQSLRMAGHDYDAKKKFDFKDIEIIKEYELGMPQVPCTKTEIEQVLLNLFKNAAAAMKQGEKPENSRIIIRISMASKMARIEIEDNGPGISEDIQARIFEPFFTTKPVGQGTGLGLSVAYMIIVHIHHGVLEVESELGKGTRFIIQLPLVQ